MKAKELHPGQIPATCGTLRRELCMRGHTAVYALIHCVLNEGTADYKNYLVVAAVCFERMSCLVYRDGDGRFKKPPADRYIKKVFDAWVETPKELFDRIMECGGDVAQTKRCFRIIRRVADIVCPMMACMDEQGFVSEYAYAIDYVVRCGGDLPAPKMRGLFPTNYPDFNYTEGIAEEIVKYGGVCF